jgi:hypothetical protein
MKRWKTGAKPLRKISGSAERLTTLEPPLISTRGGFLFRGAELTRYSVGKGVA